MMSVFLTGFPGFLGAQLAERLLRRYGQGVRINCLIQRHYRDLAERREAELEARRPEWVNRLCLVEGDITAPDLGLGPEYERLAGETFEIFHLAAVYDLAVKRDLAMRVNVDGTRNLLAFAETCGGKLRRFHHVSTCYVSGRHKGTFTEHDLMCGQTFNNYYEETKHLAEAAVQGQMGRGLPATIYRPASVVGDSETGETQKYDGPYVILQWMLRNQKLAIIPAIGDGSKHEVNFAPRDFVVAAIDYLSALEKSEGKVYQVCDAQPLSVDGMVELLGRATGARVARIPLPLGLVKRAFGLGWVQRWTGIQPTAIDYFVHSARYTCDHLLHDLQGSGITCPAFPEYVDNLVRFMRQHPEVSPDAMI